MCGLRWMTFAADTMALTVDAAAVVGLRLVRLSMLDASAAAEAWLMVEEKWESAALLQWGALSGQLGSRPHDVASASFDHVRRKVAANRRRLAQR